MTSDYEQLRRSKDAAYLKLSQDTEQMRERF